MGIRLLEGEGVGEAVVSLTRILACHGSRVRSTRIPR